MPRLCQWRSGLHSVTVRSTFPRGIISPGDYHRGRVGHVNCSPFRRRNCMSSTLPSYAEAQYMTPSSRRKTAYTNETCTDRSVRWLRSRAVKSAKHYFHRRYLCCRAFDVIVERIVNSQQFHATKCQQHHNLLCVINLGAIRR